MFLMCPPDDFSLSPPDPVAGFANDMIAQSYEGYIKDPQGFRRKAFSQWNTLKETLVNKLGVEVITLKSQPNLDDLVFTADPSLSFIREDGQEITLISNMTHPLRSGETSEHAKLIKSLFPKRKIEINTIPSEGNGDNLYDPYRNLFWSSYTPKPSPLRPAIGRSDITSHTHLSERTNAQVISLQVQRPYFHIDTTLSALAHGHIVCYEGGISSDAFKTLMEKAFYDFDMAPEDYLIRVTEEEAAQFACNIVCVGKKLIIPQCGDRVPSLLKEKGYDVFPVDLSCFIQAAGGPHCLTNDLNLTFKKK